MNWGTKLLFGMGAFVGFILVLCLFMIFSNTDDLVEKDYYERGINYTAKYQQQENALNGKARPVISAGESGITIRFPQAESFKVTCRHPFDSSRDIVKTGNAEKDGLLVISSALLAKGLWNISVAWTIRNTTSQVEQQIRIR